VLTPNEELERHLRQVGDLPELKEVEEFVQDCQKYTHQNLSLCDSDTISMVIIKELWEREQVSLFPLVSDKNMDWRKRKRLDKQIKSSIKYRKLIDKARALH